MPLDYLLSLLRDETLPRPERTFAAVAAGPYLHAKLSAVSLTTALDPERMSTEALEQAIDQAQAKWAAKPEWEKMAGLRSRVGHVIEDAGQLSVSAGKLAAHDAADGRGGTDAAEGSRAAVPDGDSAHAQYSNRTVLVLDKVQAPPLALLAQIGGVPVGGVSPCQHAQRPLAIDRGQLLRLLGTPFETRPGHRGDLDRDGPAFP